MSAVDHLALILARKSREVTRRVRHRALLQRAIERGSLEDRGSLAVQCLRRGPREPLRVIAEIKLRSPSAGLIRVREPGVVAEIASEYVRAGASAVSVLCDGPGFGGSVLDLRRAACAVTAPILFKEFVLHPLQVSVARLAGAHMVLLLVRVLPADQLRAMVDEVLRQGMAPVVEAASADELEVALGTRATLLGVNARDLRSFEVDPEQAQRVLTLVPADRIAVHMSGVRSADDLVRIGVQSRADAVLIGEGLMRAPSPGARLAEWLQETSR